MPAETMRQTEKRERERERELSSQQGDLPAAESQDFQDARNNHQHQPAANISQQPAARTRTPGTSRNQETSSGGSE